MWLLSEVKGKQFLFMQFHFQQLEKDTATNNFFLWFIVYVIHFTAE